MKAVLGFLFLLAGITVGWMVLSGNLPNANPTAPSTQVVNSSNNDANAQQEKRGGNPFGIGLGVLPNDMRASKGGFS